MALLAGFALVALTGCELKDDGDNLVNGKTLFVQKCASCHTLARADAKGTVGPSLDEAWQQSARDGLGRSTYEGIVHGQILQPNQNPSVDPATGKEVDPMPAKIVTGEDAQDVAAYVASAAANPGKDTGRLATAGAPEQEELATAEGGTLDIPADPSGALAYRFADAEAQAGPLTIN
jgi:mono/diheme cytochrome c family protein